MAHVCSQEEYDRVWMGMGSDGQIKNYDYRRAMYDFQDQQNIRSMSMDEELQCFTVCWKDCRSGTRRRIHEKQKTHSRFCQFDMEKNTVKTDLLLKDLKVAITSVATFRNFVYVSGWGDKLLVYTLRKGDSIEYPINLQKMVKQKFQSLGSMKIISDADLQRIR